jgi:V8-like Glu-specific endopeptidase
MMKRWAVTALIALWTPLAAFCQLTADEKRALEVKPAVALVVVQYEAKWTYGDISLKLPHGELGTGFFFHPDGYLITNGHVVQHANLKDLQAVQSLQAELRADAIKSVKYIAAEAEKQGHRLSDKQIVDLLQRGQIELVQGPTLSVALPNGKVLNADILQYSAPITENGKDVAVLKVPGTNYPTVPLGNSDQVRLQDTVMVMGYPGVASSFGSNPIISAESNSEASATNGHISAIKTGTIGVPLLQSDVAITHGNSGGPAFNDLGEVIGIATAGAETQGFNFLVPINTAMEFVRQTGVTPSRGAFDQHWDAGLDLYDAGQYRQSVSEFDNALQFMPDFPDAKKYRASAVLAEDHLSFMQRTLETTGKTPLYAAAGILVLGALALVWRRKRPEPQLAMAAVGGAAVRPSGQPSGPSVSPVNDGKIARTMLEKSYGSIQFTSGALSGRTFKVDKQGLWLGRDPKCGVVLSDETVSGEHAWIVPVDGTVMLIDKGSSNGTYVNSADSPRVSKIGLKNGDRIFLGKKGPVATYFAN